MPSGFPLKPSLIVIIIINFCQSLAYGCTSATPHKKSSSTFAENLRCPL